MVARLARRTLELRDRTPILGRSLGKVAACRAVEAVGATLALGKRLVSSLVLARVLRPTKLGCHDKSRRCQCFSDEGRRLEGMFWEG